MGTQVFDSTIHFQGEITKAQQWDRMSSFSRNILMAGQSILVGYIFVGAVYQIHNSLVIYYPRPKMNLKN